MDSDGDEGPVRLPVELDESLPRQLSTRSSVSRLYKDLDAIDYGKLLPTDQIDTFIGDISLGERQIIFYIWKLLYKQLGSQEMYQCSQCKHGELQYAILQSFKL